MGQEDFPYCVYCDQKTSRVVVDPSDGSIRYYCVCGDFVVVKQNG